MQLPKEYPKKTIFIKRTIKVNRVTWNTVYCSVKRIFFRFKVIISSKPTLNRLDLKLFEIFKLKQRKKKNISIFESFHGISCLAEYKFDKFLFDRTLTEGNKKKGEARRVKVIILKLETCHLFVNELM